jgi:thiamine pyrophosphate-dependent acetolactate synthase large subunit-like protein
MADRSPILIVTSSPPMRDTETNTIQGFIDQIDVGRRLTKYAQKVSQPEEIPRFVAHAYRAAVSGAPGKALLFKPSAHSLKPVRTRAIGLSL